MTFCEHCGNEVSSEAKFCRSCGKAALPPAPMTIPQNEPEVSAPQQPSFSTPNTDIPLQQKQARKSPTWAIGIGILFLLLSVGAYWISSHSSPPKEKINPKDGAVMVFVPGGEFLMGEDKDRVNVDGFYIYKTEVTVAQYRKFCDATGHTMPYAPPWGWQDEHPMINIDWQNAKAYCEWAGMNLPTERQWEKAARGTDGRDYPWGNDFDPAKAIFNTEQPSDVGSEPDGASPYGCLDMAGNVKEWCEDLYEKGREGDHVLRGGSWLEKEPSDLLTTKRTTQLVVNPYTYIPEGFRCAQGQP